MSGRTPLGIGATVQNAFAGSQYEFAPYDCTLEVGVLADKTQVSMALYSGPDVLAEPGSIVPSAAAEAAPKYPDEYHWEDEAAGGDRLKLSLTNGNAAATVVNWVVRITPA